MFRADSTAFVNPIAAIGQLQGAIRQLDDRVGSLSVMIGDASFGGVPIGQVVAGLAAAVAALTVWVGTLKKQINALEERIAKLEGVAPTPPNPET